MGKIFFKILRIILAVLVLLLLVFSVIKLVQILRYKIKTENGIQESSYIKIGDIEQFIRIRGENTDNPIVLFIHGGPGFPIGYLSYIFQADLEDSYTFVQWDQRNCGRTYYRNKDKKTVLSHQVMMQDLDELVDYLLRRFDKQKIIIMGQSWGTVLGLEYASINPDKVLSYVGVGQVVDFDLGKIEAAKAAISMIESKSHSEGSDEDKKTLEQAISLFETEKNISDIDISNLETMIVTSLKYLKGDKESGAIKLISMGLFSPVSNLQDLKWFLIAGNTKAIFTHEEPLVQYMYYEFDAYKLYKDFDVPVFFISGDSDWITPYTMVKEYSEYINAPKKNFVLINGAGHTPFLDLPDNFNKVFKSY
ncbi:MAG: alpha/beta hydrolase [Spirochaetales bacterium]|nr:alpha/beta hydrolase [Spirochaetales bacterium]